MLFKSLSAVRRIFLFWILIPFAFMLISTAVLKPFLYRHWLVIFFPALFVAVSLPLLAWRVPRHFFHAWIGLLVLGGLWRSGQVVSFIHETGDTGWHLANLSTREEVLRKLSAMDRSAALYVEVSAPPDAVPGTPPHADRQAQAVLPHPGAPIDWLPFPASSGAPRSQRCPRISDRPRHHLRQPRSPGRLEIQALNLR